MLAAPRDRCLDSTPVDAHWTTDLSQPREASSDLLRSISLSPDSLSGRPSLARDIWAGSTPDTPGPERTMRRLADPMDRKGNREAVRLGGS
jgi:hypothetical protein